MNIQHSSRTDLWYTPAPIIEMARSVLVTIDFDPASDAAANTAVGARTYRTEENSSLEGSWPDDVSIWLNPPGGKVGNRSKTGLFWERLMAHRTEGKLRHAIFLAFSAEALQNTQGKSCAPIMAFPFCVPAKRIRFVSPDGVKSAPSHSNVIVYVPGTVDRTDHFMETFWDLGWCVR
jgi:hypothetical protein